MTRFLFASLIFLSSLSLYGQIDGFGIFIGRNVSDINIGTSRIIPAFRTFGNQYGLYASKSISSRWELQSSFSFQQKGYERPVYTPGISILGGDLSLTNRLSYLSLSFSGNYIINPKSQKVKFLIFSALENNFLISNEIFSTSPHATEVGLSRHTQYDDDWEDYALSYMLGLRLRVHDFISLSMSYTGSLTPVLETEEVRIREHVLTLSLRANLFAVLRE